MSKGALCIFAFSLGAAAGAVVSWKMLENKYKQIADEEIESMREYYANKFKKRPNETVEEKSESNDEEIYEKMTQNYNKMSDTRVEQRKEDTDVEQPYVISPEEFGVQDYEVISLTYYADGVLTNDLDEPMNEDEMEWSVGLESLNHFGEYEDDSVFVRNDRLKCDYEILRDTRTYGEVHNNHRVGD